MPEGSGVYRITIAGSLRQGWENWFEPMALVRVEEPGGEPVTVLEGPVPDQAALRGILGKVWDLGLVVTGVARLGPVNQGA